MCGSNVAVWTSVFISMVFCLYEGVNGREIMGLHVVGGWVAWFTSLYLLEKITKFIVPLSSPNLCMCACACVHVQDAAMVVPPLRRSRICWQSCRDRRSPTRSRVRLASASRRARCPGGVSRGMGRWRQARRMAWALSLSPKTHSPSDSSREREGKEGES